MAELINTSNPAGAPRRSRLNLVLLTAAVALFGMAYGADSVAEGGGVLMPVLASTLIMGGASQIAAEGVLQGGGSEVAAVVVGLALNLRFVALGLIISPYLPKGGLRRLAASHLVSDHPVSFAMIEPPERRARGFLLIGLLMWGAWVGGTLIGALTGTVFDASRLGADGAIAAGFVALTVDQIVGPRAVVMALTGFVTASVLLVWAEGGLAVVGGAAVALVVGRLIGVHKELAT